MMITPNRMLATVVAGAWLGSASPAALAGPPTVDPMLPEYVTTRSVSGNLSSVGSDTLNNLMTLWAEAFRHRHPSVKIQIEGKGSSTAPPALIEGTAQLGPMSRPMKASEIDAFEKRFGYPPTPIRTAVDALAVFVHKDNPIECMSLAQVDAVFSKSRQRGLNEDLLTWGQLGLTGPWTTRPISLYGRNSASGTYGFFKSQVLEKGDYKDRVKEQPGSASVVQSVSVDELAIGYSGIGYTTSGVRAVPLSIEAGGPCVAATAENAYRGDYPLARFLFVYINQKPGTALDPLTRELLKLVLSKEGQRVVVKDGYYPLPAAVAAEELVRIGANTD